jgi:hypothetical protein
LQLRFVEVIETITTLDRLFTDREGAWGSFIVRPSGQGWRGHEARSDRRTVWERRRFVVHRPDWRGSRR